MNRNKVTGLLALMCWGSMLGSNGVVEELSRHYTFPTPKTGQKIKSGESTVKLSTDFAERFLLRFSVPGEALVEDGRLINIGDGLRVGVEDGELRATVTLCDSVTTSEEKWQDMTIGVPVEGLAHTRASHDVTVHYTGSHFTLYVDGRLYDNDFPIGTPTPGKVKATAAKGLRDITLTVTPVEGERTGEGSVSEVQYWTPPYHNAWVGDVATCWADGRYHVFYLFDRRGHASKFGKGGHYFEHLSTADLVNWTEHEAATPIEEQWETFGTGTPFEKDGKIYLTYGLHTTRIYPQERTIQPRIKEDVRNYGATVAIDYDTLTNLMPAGATYAVSEDGGRTFRKSHKLFHYCENPSIWVDERGMLRMYANYGAKGSWESRELEQGWECRNPLFPEGRDCTFPFTLGNYDYVIGGFSGMWRKPKGDAESEFSDIVKSGEDCYDGLSVPAVTTLPDGRTLIAGWIKMQNWGGALAIHEMVECSEGVLGTKFVEELIPDLPFAKLPGRGESTDVPSSYRVEFKVRPEELTEGKLTLKFDDKSYWILDTKGDRLSYVSQPEAVGKTLRERGDVSTAHDYAIPGRLNEGEVIPVRVVVKYDEKIKGSVIDIEVNGNRSMISYRRGLKSKELTRY